jgi:hypothetical protein
MAEFTIKLRDLDKLVSYGDDLKIIGSGTGRVLVSRYDKKKHEYLGDLEITGIFTELVLSGVAVKNWCKTRIVGWARESQYKELKEAYKNA